MFAIKVKMRQMKNYINYLPLSFRSFYEGEKHMFFVVIKSNNLSNIARGNRY